MDDPTNPFLLLIIIGVTFAALAIVYLPIMVGRLSWEAFKKRSMTEYEKQFPDGCPVCSFHYWAMSMGFEDPGAPVPIHRCKERENHGWRWRR